MANDSSRLPKWKRRRYLKTTGGLSTAGLAGLSGCLGSLGGGGSDSILIGGTVSQSGKYSDSGAYYVRAYNMWADNINDDGGLLDRDVEMKILDDESDPSVAVSRYEKLINQDEVDLIIGPYSSTIVYPVAQQIAEKYNMVMVEGGGTASKIFNQGFKNVFLTLPGFSEQHAIGYFEWLNTMDESKWPESCAIIYGDQSASIANADGMRQKAEENGIEIVLDEKYPADVSDLNPVLRKAKDSGAELLMGGTYFPDAVLIARTMYSIGYEPKSVLLTAGVSDQKFQETLGEKANGIAGTAWWHKSVDTPGSPEFVEQYQNEYDQVPDYHAAGAYAATQVLGLAVDRAGEIDQDKIRSEIVNGEFQTVMGELSFSASGTPSYSMVTLQWIQDNLEVVWPKQSQTHAVQYPLEF